MTTSHTPGVWSLVGTPGEETEVGAMMGTPDCIIVADTAFFHGIPTPRQLADARLISAAPDLLTALTAQRCIQCEQWLEVTPRSTDREPCDVCAPAMAAIKKATGLADG